MGREFFPPLSGEIVSAPGRLVGQGQASPLDEQRSIDGLLFKPMDPVASYFRLPFQSDSPRFPFYQNK
jgi:hypothetical protein